MSLNSERKWAIETIRELEHEPVAFELDPASGHVREWWRRRIIDSDIFVLLIDSDISLPVFDEVETARKHKKCIFVFAKDEDILRRKGKSLQNLNLSVGDFERFYNFVSNVKFKVFQDRDDLRREIIRVIASISPKLSPIPDFLVIQDWELQRIRALYVPPIGKFERAQSILDSRRFLIIAGPPHVGKTSMAYYLLSLMKDKHNLDAIVRCTEYHDITLLFSQKNVGILLDDPFGKVKFESTSMGQYIDEVYEKFAAISKENANNRNFVVITCREEVFEEALENTKVSEVPEDTIIQILQEGDYSTDDLIKILKNHLDYYVSKNSIDYEEFAMAETHAHKIVKALRFPHNIGFFVENFVKGLTADNIDTAIENAGKIKEEVEKWYGRLDKNKDYELKFFVFTAALLPDSDSSALGELYRAFINEINKEHNMKLSTPSIGYMRSKCNVYITESGLVNFKHPSYLEGIINRIRKQQSDDLILFLKCIQPIVLQPVSPFQSALSQRLSGNVWDVIHVLRVSAAIVPDHSLRLLEGLMKNARERGILAEIFGIIERIGEANPTSILPLLEELAKINEDYLRDYISHAFDKIIKTEPQRTLVCFRNLMGTKAWYLRPCIASILAKIGRDDPDMVIPILEELILDGTHYGKSNAVDALITIGREWPIKVMPVLERLAQKKDNRLKYSVEWLAAELRKRPDLTEKK